MSELAGTLNDAIRDHPSGLRAMTDWVELAGTLYARNDDLKIELAAKDALIRELVAALAAVGDQNTYDARRVLAKAKAAGYEP